MLKSINVSRYTNSVFIQNSSCPIKYKKFNGYQENNSDSRVCDDYEYIDLPCPNDELDRKFIVSYNMNNGYYVFDNPSQFYDLVESNHRHFHEVIVEGHQKMCFDIDIPYSFPEEKINPTEKLEKSKILESLLLAIEKAYDKYLRIITEREFRFDEELIVLKNHRKEKLSWHIIMRQIWMKNSTFSRYFAEKVRGLMRSNEHASYVDMQIYKKTHSFRLEGHGKFPKPGEPQTYLEQCDFTVKGVTYSKRWPREESLVSWYEGDCEDLNGISLAWIMMKEANQAKISQPIRVANMIKNDYNATTENLQKVLNAIDPNDFQHKGNEWRAFSRCIYNIWNDYDCREMWLQWCESYHSNDEEENLRLWKSFKKKGARFGVPKLRKILENFKKDSMSNIEIEKITTDLYSDSKESYPLANSTVYIEMGKDYMMPLELSEKRVKKIVRLNKNHKLTPRYIAGMKAAAGGGYLLESMLQEYYPDEGKSWLEDLVHDTRPSIRSFYGILTRTIRDNRSEFHRTRSMVEETYHNYEAIKTEYEREENSGEKLVENILRVDSMDFTQNPGVLDSDAIYIRSPTGSGKTQAMVKYLLENPELSCCIITQRVSLAADLYSHFKKCGFKHYKKESDLRGISRLIIQVESLHRILDNSKGAFDILLLDESESLVSQFMSQNIKKVKETNAIIKWLIEFSKRIICMDAYMSSDTVEMIRKFRGKIEKETMYINDTKTERGSLVRLYHYYEQLISGIIISLKKGNRIVIATNSIQKSKELYALINCNETTQFFDREIKSALYNSDHHKKFWPDLEDVNTHWKKYDVIIYTSSIETGISFTEEHFDEVFGYFTPQSTNYRSVLQMLKRVRNLHLKTINLYIKPMQFGKSPRLGEAEYDQLWQDTVGRFLDSLDYELDEFQNKVYRYKGPFYHLALINYKREVRSREDFFNLILSNLERVGYLITLEEDQERTHDDIINCRAVPESYKGMQNNFLAPIKKAIKNKQILDIKNANLSDAIVNSKEGGKETNDAKTNLAIKKCLDTDHPLTSEQIEKYRDESARRKLYNIKELNGSKLEHYKKKMKENHLKKIKLHIGDSQPDRVVMAQNNSLRCFLATDVILLKLWPDLRNTAFDIESLQNTHLTFKDIDRIRHNSQEDIEGLSRALGIKSYRMIKDIKNPKTCSTQKIIGLINTTLLNLYDIKIYGNHRGGERGKQKLSCNHDLDLIYQNDFADFSELDLMNLDKD